MEISPKKLSMLPIDSRQQVVSFKRNSVKKESGGGGYVFSSNNQSSRMGAGAIGPNEMQIINHEYEQLHKPQTAAQNPSQNEIGLEVSKAYNGLQFPPQNFMMSRTNQNFAKAMNLQQRTSGMNPHQVYNSPGIVVPGNKQRINLKFLYSHLRGGRQSDYTNTAQSQMTSSHHESEVIRIPALPTLPQCRQESTIQTKSDLNTPSRVNTQEPKNRVGGKLINTLNRHVSQQSLQSNQEDESLVQDNKEAFMNANLHQEPQINMKNPVLQQHMLKQINQVNSKYKNNNKKSTFNTGSSANNSFYNTIGTGMGGQQTRNQGSTQRLFDQKEPIVEISYKHNISLKGGLSRGMDSTSKDFLSALSVMGDEQKIQLFLKQQQQTQQNFKAAKVFTLNDQVMHDKKDPIQHRLQRMGLKNAPKTSTSLNPQQSRSQGGPMLPSSISPDLSQKSQIQQKNGQYVSSNGVPVKSRYQAMYQNKLQTIKARININRTWNTISRTNQAQLESESNWRRQQEASQKRQQQLNNSQSGGDVSATAPHNQSFSQLFRRSSNNYIENVKRRNMLKTTQDGGMFTPPTQTPRKNSAFISPRNSNTANPKEITLASIEDEENKYKEKMEFLKSLYQEFTPNSHQEQNKKGQILVSRTTQNNYRTVFTRNRTRQQPQQQYKQSLNTSQMSINQVPQTQSQILPPAALPMSQNVQKRNSLGQNQRVAIQLKNNHRTRNSNMSFRYEQQMVEYGEIESSSKRGGMSNRNYDIPTAGFLSPKNNYMSQDALYQSMQGQGQLYNQKQFLTRSGYLGYQQSYENLQQQDQTMTNMSPGSHSVDPKYLQYSGENEVKRNVHYNTHDISYTSYTDDPTWQAMAIKSHHNQVNGTQAFGNSGVLYEEGSRFQNAPNNFWMNKRNTFIGQTHSQAGSLTNLVGDQLNQSAISLDHQYDASFAKQNKSQILQQFSPRTRGAVVDSAHSYVLKLPTNKAVLRNNKQQPSHQHNLSRSMRNSIFLNRTQGSHDSPLNRQSLGSERNLQPQLTQNISPMPVLMQTASPFSAFPKNSGQVRSYPLAQEQKNYQADPTNLSLFQQPIAAQRSLAIRRQRLILAQKANQMNPRQKTAQPQQDQVSAFMKLSQKTVINKKPSQKQFHSDDTSQPDYIRYHKHKNLDLSYFGDKKDDGFEFRQPQQLMRQQVQTKKELRRPSQFLKEFDEQLDSPRDMRQLDMNNGNVSVAPPES